MYIANVPLHFLKVQYGCYVYFFLTTWLETSNFKEEQPFQYYEIPRNRHPQPWTPATLWAILNVQTIFKPPSTVDTLLFIQQTQLLVPFESVQQQTTPQRTICHTSCNKAQILRTNFCLLEEEITIGFITSSFAPSIGGRNGMASTATAVPKFDKWGLSRTKISSVSL